MLFHSFSYFEYEDATCLLRFVRGASVLDGLTCSFSCRLFRRKDISYAKLQRIHDFDIIKNNLKGYSAQLAGFTHVREKSGRKIIYQGQGKVREF